jgi:catechol 2,3-dioxygenase-like lactoylglutathione lyase family enzyme
MSERNHFENSHPILRVEDMQRSLRFYVDKLGFTSAPWCSAGFGCATRDAACIYFCLRDQGRGAAWVWVGVEDAEKLHAEFVARGVPIRMGLTNQSWALEFQVEDPDGNVLRFGSEPKPAA